MTVSFLDDWIGQKFRSNHLLSRDAFLLTIHNRSVPGRDGREDEEVARCFSSVAKPVVSILAPSSETNSRPDSQEEQSKKKGDISS